MPSMLRLRLGSCVHTLQTAFYFLRGKKHVYSWLAALMSSFLPFKKRKASDVVSPQPLASRLQWGSSLFFSFLPRQSCSIKGVFCDRQNASSSVLAIQLWSFITNPSKTALLKCLSEGSLGQTARLLMMLNQHLEKTWEPRDV